MVVLTHTNIELRLSCQNLKNKDLFSKSDPQIVVFEFNPVRSPLHAGTLLNSKLSGDERRTFWSSSSGPSDPNAWREIGRTEVIRDDLNPKFITKISMPFIFEEMQLLRFVVLDIDSQAFRIEDHDLLGVYEIPLSGIVSAQGLKKPLLRGGTISIVANEVSENKRNVNLQFSGRGLDKKDFFGKSDPYYVISRIIGQHSVAVFKSEVIKKTLDPNWRPICLPLNEICGDNNTQTQLSIEVFDWDEVGEDHDFIGACSTTLQYLLDHVNTELPLLNQKKKKSAIAGYIRICIASTQTVPSFLEYIAGGTEISVQVSIDFTGSNGDPRFPNSLHYISPDGRPNEYQRTISAVGSILEPYDTDRMIPCFGFGAVFRSHNTSHCFALNGNESNPSVHGIAGILNTYSNSLTAIQLSGPTNFAPTIEQVSAKIKSEFKINHENKYNILLILTDGAISDMEKTIDAIVLASELPLSIIIVGVGKSSFGSMENLDADITPLKHSSGRMVSKRDIVQFVPFRKFDSQEIGHHLLAKEVLAEIPGQLVSYFLSKEILPKVRKSGLNEETFPQDGKNDFVSAPPSYDATQSGSSGYKNDSDFQVKNPHDGFNEKKK